MASNPIRTCVVCRKKGTKDNFIKLVKNKDGEFIISESSAFVPGRGAYICNNPECIDKALKTKAFNRAFKTNVPINVYEGLKKC